MLRFIARTECRKELQASCLTEFLKFVDFVVLSQSVCLENPVCLENHFIGVIAGAELGKCDVIEDQ